MTTMETQEVQMKTKQSMMTPRRFSAGQMMLAAMLLVCATHRAVQAADTTTNTWKTYNNGTFWSVAGNWNGGVPVSSQGTVLQFPAITGAYGSSIATNDIASPFLLNGIVFSNASYGVTLLGGDLQFSSSAGGILPSIAENYSQGATINNNLNLTTTLTAGGIGSGAITLGGTLSGTGSLTKNGTFALTSNGTNTYAGGTTINAGTVNLNGPNTTAGNTCLNGGTLSLGNNQGLGAGSLTVSGGVVQASKAIALTNDLIIAGEATLGGTFNLSLSNLLFATVHTLTNLNTATTTITGTNGGGGTLFAKAGSLILSNAGNSSSSIALQPCGGGITLVGGGTFGLVFGTPNVTTVAGPPGTVTLNPLSVGNTTFAFGTVTNGAAAMGTLVVNTGIAGSTNVVNIGTLVRVGRSTLAVTPQNGLGPREQVSIASGADPVNNILPPWIISTTNGGEFLANGSTGLTNASYTVTWNTANGTNGSTPSATDVVKVLAPTTLTNNISAFALNVQGGRINLNGNTLTLGSGASGALILTNGFAITNGGTLALNATETLAYVGSGNNGVVAANLSGAGSLTKFGAGTLSLSNFTTLYTGDTLIDAGALSFNAAQNFSYTNNINGGGTLVKDGPCVFTVVNSTGTLGGVTVNNGTLAFAGGVRNEQTPPLLAASGTLLLNNGVQYANFVTNTTFGIGGALVMTGTTNTIGFVPSLGTVSVNGGGTLAVGASAALTITNGSLTVNGGNVNIGTVSAPGTILATNAALTMSGSGSTLVVTNGTLFAKGMNLASANNVSFTILSNGVVDLQAGSVAQPVGSGNNIVINGGILTNLLDETGGAWNSIHIPGGIQSTLTVMNGGQFFTPTNSTIMVGGVASSGGCTLFIGGSGSVSTARVGGITIGGGRDSGAAGTSLNRMIVSNGVLYSAIGNAVLVAGTSIGWDNNNGVNTLSNNSVSVLAGGYWDVGAGPIYLGRGGAATAPRINNALTVNAGIVTNAGTVTIGVQNTWGNSVTVTNGGSIASTGLALGSGGTRSNSVVLAANSVWNAGGGALTWGSGAGSFSNSLTVDGSSFLTNITGLTLGDNNTTFSMANSTGGYVLNGLTTAQLKLNPGVGTLTVGPAGSIGTALVLNNYTLAMSNGVIGASASAKSNTVTVGGSAFWNNTSSIAFNGAVNTLTITNGGQVSCAGSTIGNATAGSSNMVAVAGAGSAWNLGGAALTLGATGANTGNVLTVTGGAVTNITTLSVGAIASANNNSVLMTGGGLLECTGVVVGATGNAGNTVNNQGGILQFTSALPTITTNAGNAIVMTNGTLGYRGIQSGTLPNLTNNWGKTVTGCFAWQGVNGFRLDNALATNSLGRPYTFSSSLGATNYARLELVNGATGIRGAGVTVAGDGSMLVSNTAATIYGAFTNNGSLTLTRSTLTFATNAVLGGTVTIDLSNLGTSGVLIANRGLTLSNATLQVRGTLTNGTLTAVTGALSGQFDTVLGLDGSSYAVSYKGGQAAIIYAPKGTAVFFQ